MKKKLQVFVSSTFIDLQPERQAAVQAILKAGHIPAGMELFTASDKSQWETIKRWINESDVYMLILGGRYGSVDPATNVSYTEMEYNYAVEQGKPHFAVVIREEALEARVKIHGSAVLETKLPGELQLFREKVLSSISSFFADERDVRLAVHESLGDLRDNPDLNGWVSGADAEDAKPLHEEIKRLKEEISNLNARQKAGTASRGPSSLGTENFEELITILTNTPISVPTAISASKVRDQTLLSVTLSYRDYLVNGIKSSAYDDGSKFLYSNICPKLIVHDLVDNEKVTGTQIRRSYLNQRGKSLLAEIDRRTRLKNDATDR